MENSDKNRLTDVSNWDDQWSQIQTLKKIATNDPILGTNGAFLRSLESRIGPIPESTVIELGAAASAYLLCLAKFRNVSATGVDYSEIGLEHLKKMFRQEDLTLETIKGDLWEIDYSNNQYDFVVHWGLIEHFINPENVLDLSSRLLKPEGRLIFTMPNMLAFGVGCWKRWDGLDFSRHIFHPRALLKRIGSEVGLELEEDFYWGAPLLFNIGYWRKDGGILPSAIKLFVRASSLVNRIFPFYHLGNRFFSSQHAYIFRKIEKLP